jgi:hypothetical protein
VLPLVAERRVVAALPSSFTVGVGHQEQLASTSTLLVQKLGNCTIDREDLAQLFDLPAPWPDEIYALAARDRVAFPRPEVCTPELPDQVKLVFSNPHWAIFRIRR